MITSTFQNITSLNKQRLEALFLLSPLVVLLISIFNIADAKSILSRLIPLVGLYCLWFYREAIKQNLQTARTHPLIVMSFTAFLFFGSAHLLRGDAFGYSRTLVTCLAYLILLPWAKISRQYLIWLLPIAAIFCGLNAFYEFWALDIPRVGIATNPIPYALFCAVMTLTSLHAMFTAQSLQLRMIGAVGSCFAGAALVLTDVRGVILFFPVVLTYMILRVLRTSYRGYVAVLLATAVVCGFGYKAFEKKIDKRIAVTVQEVAKITSGNFDTSIGSRLILWQRGINSFSRAPILGVGDIRLEEDIKALSIHGANIQPHLHNQYIDTLARYGILGLFIQLAWLLSPLFYNKSQGGVGIKLDPLLSSLILMIALAGLTDVPFHHTHLVYLFTMLSGAWLLMQNGELSKK
ncbi:O-antigen ligase family protein [Enterovibrio sp. Hal110]